MAENFETNNHDWAHGNFNGGGGVDFGDFLALSANFGTTLTRREAAAVPEPTGISLGMFGFLGLVAFRRMAMIHYAI